MNAIKMNMQLMIEDMLRQIQHLHASAKHFGKSFTYDQYGFPNVNINRALRQGIAVLSESQFNLTQIKATDWCILAYK